ncbi:zinc chelation protein SecC [Salinimonas sp. HHU 13199]|uniref:Zinc chelation protein SecC n=1 Tax=Salinimonas profundi TaxID=2729140 RepID=A0ABR8LI46_9ALTE|nr:YchJ family metal-binding protein [Salinimonas profundi]MBD3584766.1 zinc chelation protein SecC [Salinimonas profundi]
MNCYCCSGVAFTKCCAPLVERKKSAESAEALMRSRFTAYCLGDYQYIFDTYTTAQKKDLSVESLAKSASGTKWFALNARPVAGTDSYVEFSAYYFENKKTGVLHETSQFVFENNAWRYDTGTIHPDTGTIKIGRNDHCPCGSGKKFKQCCMKLTA